ncbi:uncharacterized protein LOC131217206 isoform X2 [Magnolia sinica]|uniref:uncharacterized protein LOC131217206 isoform X2 n=1 Tax=Magnolia sinica TaxID=86752 RepID=UPI0026593799|nr:uncharacterized protein LOC131217206 isoform X2 [Magnolia sinica]
MATIGGRFRELMKKYGKVALGVHFSVSAASITGIYVAIKNNVDVESLFDKIGLSSSSKPDPGQDPPAHSIDGLVIDYLPPPIPEHKKNRTAELAASSGGALALAVICNKALFPVRVPITIALTPAVARFLARRRIIKNSALAIQFCITPKDENLLHREEYKGFS